MSPLEQLIMSKMQEGKQMSPLEQQAKMKNLMDLKSEMHGMMKGHLDPKDQSAHLEMDADSPEGLKAGLDEAGEALDSLHGDEQTTDDEEPDNKGQDGGMEADASDHDDDEMSDKLSPEEMQQLKMLLSKMQG